MSAVEDEVLLVDEVARLVRIPAPTLRSWRSLGRGPVSFKLGGRRVGYMRSDVEAWLEQQRASTSKGDVA